MQVLVAVEPGNTSVVAAAASSEAVAAASSEVVAEPSVRIGLVVHRSCCKNSR